MLNHSYKGQRELLCFRPSYVSRTFSPFLSLPTTSRPTWLGSFSLNSLLIHIIQQQTNMLNRFTNLRHFCTIQLESRLTRPVLHKLHTTTWCFAKISFPWYSVRHTLVPIQIPLWWYYTDPPDLPEMLKLVVRTFSLSRILQTYAPRFHHLRH